MLERAYFVQALTPAAIPTAKLKTLADRVYEQCDAKDGLKDGLIDDPRRCGFQPARDLPRCADGADDTGCFTAVQIAAIERVYSDVYSQGKRAFPGWPVGSETGWAGQGVNGANGAGVWTRYPETFFQYMASSQKDPTYTISRFDLDKELPRLAAVGQILDATDTDLSAFQKRGGRILMYVGWADPQLNPMMAVEYYDKVTQRFGTPTSDFFRLFMVPGMAHCGGGVGTSVFDADTPLVKWVESGGAPDQIAASRMVNNQPVRTRPLCAYPQVARYKGSGSVDEAANFSCVKP
jgi:feruloyl esterase